MQRPQFSHSAIPVLDNKSGGGGGLPHNNHVDNQTVYKHPPWEFQSNTVDKMLPSVSFDQWEKDCGDVKALPEVIFDQNTCTLVCAVKSPSTGKFSGMLKFCADARGALQNAQKFYNTEQYKSVKDQCQVPAASSKVWQDRREKQGVHDVKIDFAFRNNYGGEWTFVKVDGPETVSDQVNSRVVEPKQVIAKKSKKTDDENGDADADAQEDNKKQTTTGDNGDGDDVTNGNDDSVIHVEDSELAENGGKYRIDYEMLKRPEPIRYFVSHNLFEDDIHDSGDTKMSIKLRVMDSCFFGLIRHEVRVDGVILVVRDVRIFHVFSSPHPNHSLRPPPHMGRIPRPLGPEGVGAMPGPGGDAVAPGAFLRRPPGPMTGTGEVVRCQRPLPQQKPTPVSPQPGLSSSSSSPSGSHTPQSTHPGAVAPGSVPSSAYILSNPIVIEESVRTLKFEDFADKKGCPDTARRSMCDVQAVWDDMTLVESVQKCIENIVE